MIINLVPEVNVKTVGAYISLVFVDIRVEVIYFGRK